MVHSHPILAFFDSNTPYYLISDGSSTSPSIIICMDAQEISTESSVIVTYVIRQTVSLHEERMYEMIFQI